MQTFERKMHELTQPQAVKNETNSADDSSHLYANVSTAAVLITN